MNYLEFGVLQVSLSCSDSMPPRYFIARPRVPCIFALPCCLPKFSSSFRGGCRRGASDFFTKSVKKVRKKCEKNLVETMGSYTFALPTGGNPPAGMARSSLGKWGKPAGARSGGVVPRGVPAATTRFRNKQNSSIKGFIR